MEGYQTNPLAIRLFESAVAMFDILALYLGDRLGLYDALAEGTATSTELAGRTGTVERYVREWLEQQAVAGIVTVDDPRADALARRYRLPDEHREVLVDRDNVNYQAHKGVNLVRAARPLPALVEAFRTGEGLPTQPWLPDGRAEFNRARFLNLMAGWLRQSPEVNRRLRAEPPAMVADLGCGTGWSSIALALAYPTVRVAGIDLDPAPIEEARTHARDTGVDDRVTFEVRDASDRTLAGRYDLVTVFEALHDMARPVDALRVMKEMLAEDGMVLVADERVADRFGVPGDERERYAYGWSVVSCLPAVMGAPDSAETGAVMRPDTLRRYAEEAGFARVEVLPIMDDEWRFYRLSA